MEERLPRKLAVILHADVVGYSRLAEKDEDTTHRNLKEFVDLITELISTYYGRVVKTAGDAVLAVFESATDALSCAVAIQHDVAQRNQELPTRQKFQFRIGVNSGDVIEDNGDIFGDGVNVAARLEGLAEPGGICIAESVYTSVGSKLPLEYTEMGEQSVKNIEKQIRAYQVQLRKGAEPPGPSPQHITSENHKPTAWNPIFISAVVLLIVVGVTTYWFTSTPEQEVKASPENMAYPLPDKPSVAVLPFDNLSNEQSQEVVSDGISEDLTTDLSKISGLFVIARNSAFQYKGKTISVARIAEELGVRYIIEGSVRQSGNQIRINAQLIDTTTGGHIWADRYDGSTENVFSVQDDFVRRIVDALEVKLTSEELEEIGLGNTSNLAAREAFQKGWNQFLRYTPIDNAEAVSHFKTALDLDPEYGKAYAAMGMSYLRGCQLRWHEPLQMGIDEAYAAAGKYQGLMKTYPSTLANVASSQISLYQGHHKKALSEATRALTTDPNDPEGYVAMAWSMITDGNEQAGLEMMDKARRLNPTHPNYYYFAIGMAYYSMGELDQAAKVFTEALDKDPGATQLAVPLAVTYANLGKRKEAQEALKFWKQDPTEQELKALPSKYHFPYKWADDDRRKKNQFVDGLQLAVLPSDITVSSLSSDLEQGEDMDRRVAAARLGLFGPAAVEAVPALVKALDDKSKFVGKTAARSLGKIGPEAQSAIPALKAVKEPIVAAEARKSIKLISGG